MKKNGRKWRRIQRERNLHKAGVAVAAEPFSNACKRKMLCRHYAGRPGGILPGACHSLLIEQNENECMCVMCKKHFPVKRMEQMNQLVSYLSGKGCTTDEKLIAELSCGIEPVFYHRISETEIRIIENDLK